MADSDSDEDTFVTIGTPLEPLVEDAPRKKAPQVQDETVRDEKGRRRFHGAFTGGFSAGYFNTVGSKEGWTPSSFVSSRTNKAETQGQKPEDYMDAEDLGEFGIAPRKLKTADNFTSEQAQKKHAAERLEHAGVFFTQPVLQDLIIPSQLPMGVRLLRKMGWKEGQGVGPRVKRKAKKQATAQEGKVYGCSLPPDQNSDDSDYDEYAAGLTFAPKDVTPISFEAKDNQHGLGYSGLNPKAALHSGHINLFEPSPIGGSTVSGSKRGIRGKAFGVGALEDDDEDIYGMDSMANYDRELTAESDHNFGWTAPKRTSRFSEGPPAAITEGPSHVTRILEGFTIASKPLQPKKCFPPPHIPRGYKPFHTFLKPKESSSASSSGKSLDAGARGAILGETPVIGSVFELVNSEGKAKLEAAKISSTTSSASSTSSVTTSSAWSSATSWEKVQGPFEAKQPLLKTPLFQGNTSSFKPFVKDPAKQERYEKYLELKKQGAVDCYKTVALPHMTEWDMEREEEEFKRAAQLFKPLSSLMASRFTRAKFEDHHDEVEVPPDDSTPVSDQAKAAQMKMFGKLTRERFEWHPDRLLCRRFNVPDPYPGSTIVGVPTVKKDKFSLYNFLSVPVEKRAPSPPKALTAADESEQPRMPKSIFDAPVSKRSVLRNPAEKSKTESTVNKETKSTSDVNDLLSSVKESEVTVEGRPPMDLFKAIFQDSDSSSSSSSEEEEEEEKQEEKSSNKQSLIDQPVMVPTQQEHTTEEKADGNSTIPVESLQQRLSPPPAIQTKNGTKDEDEEMEAFGPALPPPSAPGESPSATPGFPSHVFISASERGVHRKLKHAHRSKESDRSKKKKKKKEKKAKYKKSKHKHKSSKKKKKSKTETPSSSEDSNGGSDSSEDESKDQIPTDAEILERLKGQRMRAADFM
ncbi:G patch domain-containing protein 1 [Lingula anatina]|uniref:G patch domain-containing protein 1 n=1 Tax=Lingula anatina TaxID=7574 RepID=A0A1S3H2E3_LINAN|nr:G patch domain-containing protein 1 [Lingula anatina]|eukprot:XP_013380300.1 G patch domain-containing protein 1 [Lingula anatina]